MAGPLEGKVAWITGGGSGIGEAAARALSGAGATVVLTGRRPAPLEAVAARLSGTGGVVHVMQGDVSKSGVAETIVTDILKATGCLDILINNAGGNLVERRWSALNPERIDTLLSGNLTAALYCAAAALRPMREAKEGLLIHTGSWSGRFWGNVSGGIYTAAKTAITAMSHSINMEEYENGIRSTVVMPAEVATPILDRRPVPPPPEVRATMLQPSDLGDLFLFLATRPRSVVVNEVVISPAVNRMYTL